MRQKNNDVATFYRECSELVQNINQKIALDDRYENHVNAVMLFANDLIKNAFIDGLNDPVSGNVRSYRPESLEAILKAETFRKIALQTFDLRVKMFPTLRMLSTFNDQISVKEMTMVKNKISLHASTILLRDKTSSLAAMLQNKISFLKTIILLIAKTSAKILNAFKEIMNRFRWKLIHLCAHVRLFKMRTILSYSVIIKSLTSSNQTKNQSLKNISKRKLKLAKVSTKNRASKKQIFTSTTR